MNFYKFLLNLILFGVVLKDIGNTIFGYVLPFELHTIFAFIAFVLVLLANQLHLQRNFVFLFMLLIVTSLLATFLHAHKYEWKFIMMIFIFATVCSSAIANIDILNVLKIYAKFAEVLSALVLIQFLLFLVFRISFLPQNLLSGEIITTFGANFIPEVLGFLPRAVAVFKEPAHYGVFMAPINAIIVGYILKDNFSRQIVTRRNFLLFVLSSVLSFSLVCYLSFAIAIFLFVLRKLTFLTVLRLAPILVTINILMSNGFITQKVSSFKSSFKSTESVNLITSKTSYALISNSIVAWNSQIDHYGLGSGVNNHDENYDKYIKKVNPTQTQDFTLNREDGASLGIRLISEIGIFGFAILIIFILNTLFLESSTYLVISSIVIFVFLARLGHYLDLELWLFISLFLNKAKMSG